ncbi:glycosyltransferase [Pedobacter changchengzhani]|uniref:Glycosyltransferase n=1 Tax=Pedobacter changchengzhani TaxID=2529274 RepID=A0A4R5MMI4_9SPHI|nr:glycosyltransferase [Pedobacter changchengzhani]TDG36495.1 glycosyltransferase [Pedobacter changchengzhani]
MNSCKISVIIPTHNNGIELRRAIMSIIAQDSKHCTIEIIIVNDASDREFLAQLDQLILDFPGCKLLNTTKQCGPAGARNLGILAATGDFISFLDADDEWPNNKLSILLPYFISSDVEVAGGKVKYIVQDDQPAINMNFEDEQKRLTHVHLGALLVKKSIFENRLLFDESLIFSEDIDWWYRLRENGIKIVICEATTLNYHVHGSNMSVNKDLNQLNVLKVLHQSIQRRKNLQLKQHLPQIKDFRIDQKDPLISIIVPLYNGKNLIKKTLDSVVSQTYTNWELIIVDDGSTDGGAEFIMANYPMAKIFEQKNAGVANARNNGVKYAEGEILAFLDQDDEWEPTKLKDQWAFLKKDPYCTFVTCNQAFVCEDGVSLPPTFDYKYMEEHRSFIPSGILIRKYILIHVNLFDETLKVSSDMDLIRKLRNAGCKEGNVEKLLLKKWFHGSNESQNTSLMLKEMLGMLHKQIKVNGS